MTTVTAEKELLDLETQYWQAIKEKNVDDAVKLTDEPCIVTGASGAARINRNAFRGMLQNATWTLNEFELSDDAQVTFPTDDVAIVAYKVKENLTVDGKPLVLEAADASTWVRRNGRWLCALHTESILGDPFGRDRARQR